MIAEAQGKSDDALALYRAAFALEEAHARQRGGSWLRKTRVLVRQRNRAGG